MTHNLLVRGQADSYRAGAAAALPLAIAVSAFSASFGVLAHAARLGRIEAMFMSASTFAGSAQLAAEAVLAQGGGVVTAIVTVALLNARYIPIGASVARVLSPNVLLRFLQAQLVVDESWALAYRDGRPHGRRLVGAGLTLYTAWLGGTAAGVLGGGFIGDPSRLGLDAAFPALFLALVVPQLRNRRAVIAALLGTAIALVLVPLAPPGVPVLAAVLACFAGLRR